MAIYSTRFASGYLAGPVAGSTIYTAPSTGVVVLRDIVLMHSGTALAALGVYTVSGSNIAHMLREVGMVAGRTLHWAGRQVLAPGEALVLASDSNGSVYFRVSGYILGL